MSDTRPHRLLRLSAVLLVISYPFLIYLGLQRFEPKQLVLLLVLIAVLRVLSTANKDAMLLYWLAAVMVALISTLLLGSDLGLLFYPVLVNAAFLLFFLLSYFRPPTVIQTIAERFDGPLPPEGVAYTRKVTLVWCAFFVANGAVSSYTVFADREYWLIYNGLVSYLLMGVLFAGEYLVRRRVMKHAS